MTSARKTRYLVGLGGGEQVRIGGVDRTFLERARTEVAVQTLAIVERVVETDGLGSWRSAEIVHIHVLEAMHLGAKAAKHRVVGVAGVAGLVGGNAVVLKVGGSQVGGIVHQQALAVWFHLVTGETKLGPFGTIDVIGGAHTGADQREQEQHEEAEYLSTLGRGHAGAKHEHADQKGGDHDREQEKCAGKRHRCFDILRRGPLGLPRRAWSGFPPQAADVGDEGFNLFRLQAPSVRRHLILAVGYDAGQICIALLLDIRRTEIVDLVRFTYRGLAFSVGAVANGTFRFVHLLAWFLGARRKCADPQEYHQRQHAVHYLRVAGPHGHIVSSYVVRLRSTASAESRGLHGFP